MKKIRLWICILAAMLLMSGVPAGNMMPLYGAVAAEAASVKPQLTLKKKTIYVGDTFTLTLKNCSKKVKWTTSKKSVAKIKANGTSVKVTGKKAGKATITAKVGKKKYKCKVTVKKKPAALSEKIKTIEEGEIFELSLKNGGSAKWSVSNKKILAIKKYSKTKYLVLGKKAGTATITVKYKGKKYKCTVTVKKSAYYDGSEEYKHQYDYEVVFLNPPYTECVTPVYIKTKNPDADNLDISLLDSSGEYNMTSILSPAHDDIGYTGSDIRLFYPVEGGYLTTIQINKPGKNTIIIREYDSDPNSYDWREDVIGTVTVADYDKEYNAWMDQIIAKCVKTGMTKQEQMAAIADYLYKAGNYPALLDTPSVLRAVSLAATEGIPAFKKMEWDSYISPYMLEDFGEKIGYPLRSLYADYERGTDEWTQYHAFAQSTQDGSMYACTPPVTTTYTSVAEVPQIDFSKY